MKKSNKILLSGFLTLLLLFVAIHIALFAKYRTGNYTNYTEEDELSLLSLQQFPNILFVSVHNLPRATVKFSDVARVEKGDEGIQYTQKGDTLQITGGGNNQAMNGSTTIYLPYNTTVSLQNASLFFVGGTTMVQNNPTLYLQNASVIFSSEQNPLQLGHLRIRAADNSTVSIGDNTGVGHLDVQLSNSSVEGTKGNVRQLSITTDSLSRISLTAKQLVTATIRTTTPE